MYVAQVSPILDILIKVDVSISTGKQVGGVSDVSMTNVVFLLITVCSLSVAPNLGAMKY